MGRCKDMFARARTIGLLHEPVLRAQFHICQANGAGVCSAGKINRVVRGQDGPKRQNRVNLHIGRGSPVELKRRAWRVYLHRSRFYHSEDICFVVPKVDGRWVIRSKGRPRLRQQSRNSLQDEENQAGKATLGPHRRCLILSGL